MEDSQTEQMERKAFALPDPGQKPYSDLASWYPRPNWSFLKLFFLLFSVPILGNMTTANSVCYFYSMSSFCCCCQSKNKLSLSLCRVSHVPMLPVPQASFQSDWLLSQRPRMCLFLSLSLQSSSSVILDADPVSLRTRFHRTHFLHDLKSCGETIKNKENPALNLSLSLR